MFGSRAFKAIKPSDIEQFLKPLASPTKYNSALCRVSGLFNWAIRMQLVDMRNPCTPIRMKKVVRRRRDYSTEQIRDIATHIFYPLLQALPETDHLEGFAKRDAALVKARVATANDQMQELCNYMGILFLTMARPGDLNNAEFSHFDLEKLGLAQAQHKGDQAFPIDL